MPHVRGYARQTLRVYADETVGPGRWDGVSRGGERACPWAAGTHRREPIEARLVQPRRWPRTVPRSVTRLPPWSEPVDGADPAGAPGMPGPPGAPLVGAAAAPPPAAGAFA